MKNQKCKEVQGYASWREYNLMRKKQFSCMIGICNKKVIPGTIPVTKIEKNLTAVQQLSKINMINLN